jgi:hypothetical protein
MCLPCMLPLPSMVHGLFVQLLFSKFILPYLKELFMCFPCTTLQWTKLMTHPVNDLVMEILKMDKHRDIQSHGFLRYGSIKFWRRLFYKHAEPEYICIIRHVPVDAVWLFLDEICK